MPFDSVFIAFLYDYLPLTIIASLTTFLVVGTVVNILCNNLQWFEFPTLLLALSIITEAVFVLFTSFMFYLNYFLPEETAQLLGKGFFINLYWTYILITISVYLSSLTLIFIFYFKDRSKISVFGLFIVSTCYPLIILRYYYFILIFSDTWQYKELFFRSI